MSGSLTLVLPGSAMLGCSPPFAAPRRDAFDFPKRLDRSRESSEDVLLQSDHHVGLPNVYGDTGQGEQLCFS
ncbi:MAG: hypothetical protein ACKN9U_09845, partial [Pirellulaceae bacterium]